jgi:hypothetical protein
MRRLSFAYNAVCLFSLSRPNLFDEHMWPGLSQKLVRAETPRVTSGLVKMRIAPDPSGGPPEAPAAARDAKGGLLIGPGEPRFVPLAKIRFSDHLGLDRESLFTGFEKLGQKKCL